MNLAEDLVTMLADLKEKEVIKIVEARLTANEDPLKILDNGFSHLWIWGEIYHFLYRDQFDHVREV